MIGGKYFILLIILFLNLVVILKMGLRINYLGELLLFVLFLISALVIIKCAYKEKACDKFGALFFLISLINLFYIKSAFVVHPTINVGFKGWFLFGVTLFLNAIGFLISVALIEKGLSSNEKEEIIEKEIEPKLKELEAKLEFEAENKEQVEIVKVKKTVQKEFKPGKFVASKTGSVYHAPKCDWAKKISKKNQVWFNTKDQAKKKGYKQHSCLSK
jgi:hypothetical protein|tara:strand:+ start:841 stop:1488 length:648 start_codon:yes stop_codon:yes gene_type:complete